MIVRFNPTGTHVQKGLLKVRLDLYPDVSSKTYALHYVPHFDREPTREELADKAKLALIPTHLELNPCLCHFIVVPELFALEDLENYVHGVFDKDTLATLDNVLILPNSIHHVSPLMRNRGKFSDKAVIGDAVDLISSINDRFKNIAVSLEGDGEAYLVEPESIDVGSPATDRDDTSDIAYNCEMVMDNPVNENGNIDTIEVWINAGTTYMRIGFYFLVSGTTYEQRSHHDLETIAAGSKQTFSGLTVPVLTGDLICIGQYENIVVGDIERDSSGYSGFRYHTDLMPADEGQKDFSGFASTSTISLYATGTGGGGGWEGTRHWKSTKEVFKPDIWVSEWELTDGSAARETAVDELIALLPETIEEIT